MIARLQMSDLHLGDCRSVLGDPEIVRQVTDDLAHLSGGYVCKLILAGDVWEESVPEDLGVLEDGIAKTVLDASTRFFATLFGKVGVGEIVVVPGNHDLCTWSWYRGGHGGEIITPSTGIPVNSLDWPWRHLLAGSTVPLTIAYPLYWDKSAVDARFRNISVRDAGVQDAGADYPVLFVTHGHLLDPLVLGEDFAKYPALQALGVPRPTAPSLEEVDSVARLAEGTLDFCLGLWKRYSPRDYIYSNYVMRRLDHPESCLLQKSSITWIDEGSGKIDDPFPQQGNFANVQRFLDLAIRDPNLPTPVGSLGGNWSYLTFMRPSCLTFGHDHRGTFRKVVSCGVPFVVADSGGWTAEWEGHVPHTHVLVWNKMEDVVPAPYLVNIRRKA